MITRGARNHIEDANNNRTGYNIDLRDSLLDIQKLLEKQNNLLEKLVKPRYETDSSLQPLPPVSARSSSAWNSLLTSTLNNTAPIIGRWQGGLDTLLIFVGFFSSIVTSFLVDSSHSLRADETMRTNELLANLTEIILFVSGDRAANILLPTPMPFVPDPADVRVNVYWSLALILSISAAALAVAGRGFLSLLIKSEGDVVTKLTELYQRRAQARTLLGPVLEALPQFLVIPFALFVLGLLDDLLSSSLSNPDTTFPTLVSSALLCIVVAAVGLLLIGAVAHGIIYPRTSPFPTLLSQNIWRRKSFKKPILDDFLAERNLNNFNRHVFHSVIQETFEDETLDQASAALEGIIFDNAEPSTSLTDLEIRTILHLLSPEASLRSNLSAARIVMNFSPDPDPESKSVSYSLSPTYRTALLLALRHAADRHQANWPHLVEWHQNSLFVSAMASLIPSSLKNKYPHPMIALLSANHLPLQEIPTELREAYISLVWQAVSSLTRALGRLTGAKRDEQLQTTLRQILGPCSVDSKDGTALLLSLVHSPVPTSETSYRDMADYTVIIECICKWLAEGEFAADMVLRVVHRVLLENVRPEGYSPYQSFPGVIQTVFKFVLCKTEDLSFDNLLVCINFILRVQETFLWDVGHFMTLRVIIRFLDLLEQSRSEMHKERREWNICHNAFIYVHQWMLYKASGLGEYNDSGLPSRKDILERMKRISKEFFDADQGDVIPLPLPEWEMIISNGQSRRFSGDYLYDYLAILKVT